MKLTCFQQTLLDLVLADYDMELSEEAPPFRPKQAATIFRKAQRRWHPIPAAIWVAGWVSILLIPALVLGFWITRDRNDPPPIITPTIHPSQTTDPTEITDPTEPTEPATVAVQLPAVKRYYTPDGTLLTTTTYTYDARGLLLTCLLTSHDGTETGQITQYTYDEQGNLLTFHNKSEDGHVDDRRSYRYTYDKAGTLTGFTTPENSYEIRYNRQGQIERILLCLPSGETADALVCEYENGLLRYVYDLRLSHTPLIYSFPYDEQGLPLDWPLWSRTLPEGWEDTVLTRKWENFGEFQLTYTGGVLSNIQDLSDTQEICWNFQLDEYGNTTRIATPAGYYTEYDFISLSLDADWARKQPCRTFHNEVVPFSRYPDNILRLFWQASHI